MSTQQSRPSDTDGNPPPSGGDWLQDWTPEDSEFWRALGSPIAWRTLGLTTAALEAYEVERRPATSELVMLNRRNGPEQVMQLVEERAPDGFDVVTDVLSRQELEDIANTYKKVAGFQVDALNAKPPIVPVKAA